MNIYQHFRKEEHHFIDQVLEWRESVQTQYSPRLTDFLDPREQEIVRLVIGHDEEVNVSFFGGASFVERKRALLYPPYFQPEQEDFMIALFSVRYPSKFVSLAHRQVLGSLMSLGLKRGKFGDVLIKENDVQLIVAKEVADYVRLHLQAVGKTKISLEEKPLTDMIVLEEQWNEATITVSSLRLDAVVAQAFGASRQHVQTLIENGLVKVNWKIVEQSHLECKEGDTISARGLGRLKLVAIGGKTKKDRFRIQVGTQK
ncbi:YlmH family RNA-binding protein [Anoxybacillus sp. J5B_2022]|uniref:YlmH family RNA-binding protein n=1 Tax=Anoxybacillus sp. J5B_2022 TaxID=3003246 RepID=UPI0022866594|nr:RNA-binding protein [Anoxybacillus sp. J5B_2022]MCZ0755511.1 RNA-binding protein [Anoxybacillus sp. J5B_2022]